MPLTPPKLDDRDFQSLFEDARSRIPLYLPEWTDWNDSDPGITLLRLHAWLTETVLHRLNQLPELNYLKFLQLLGVEQDPARPAQADLTFMLKDSVAAAELFVPAGAVVSVSDRDLPEPVFFETDRTLVAISSRLARLHQVTDTGEARDVSHANEADGRVVTPFCGAYSGDACDPAQAEAEDARLVMGFTAANPFSRQEVGLQFYLAQPGETLLAPATEADCAPPATGAGPVLAWEWWDGFAWSDLELTADETANLTGSGQVYFRVPGQIPAVAAHAVKLEPVPSAPSFDDVAGIDALATEVAGLDPPGPGQSPRAALDAKLDAAGIRTVDDLAAADPDALCDVLLPNAPDTSDASIAAAVARVEVGIAGVVEDAARLVEPESLHYWLQVKLATAGYEKPPVIDRILTNTVRATASRSVANEIVGTSDGKPGQVMRVANVPIVGDPRDAPDPRPLLELEVPSAGEYEAWEQVADFLDSEPDSKHYVLSPATGEIAFGDGRRGRIPPAADLPVVARRYRHGGGVVGNVGAGTITDLLTPLRDVDTVENLRPATGGEDEEPLEDTKLRVPRQVLKARDRAVTIEDFEVLAREAEGARVARAHALVRPDPATSCPMIQVIVVPQSAEARPQPQEAELRLVCRYLDARRLLTTRLAVTGPTYRDFDAELQATADPHADLRTVKNAVLERLAAYFHVLTGGVDGRGLDFGRPVTFSEIVREVMALPGVARVSSVAIRKYLKRYTGGNPEAAAALAADLAAEPAGGCQPAGEVVEVVEPGEAEGEVRRVHYTAAVHDCCDMPVAAGELPALRLDGTRVTVDYEREGGAP